MPDNARPWVHPVSAWVLPNNNSHVENESHAVNHNIHHLVSDSTGRALPAWTARDSNAHGNRVNRPGNSISQPVGREANGNTSNLVSPVGGGGSRGHDKIKQFF